LLEKLTVYHVFSCEIYYFAIYSVNCQLVFRLFIFLEHLWFCYRLHCIIRWMMHSFLADVNLRSRSLYAIALPSVCLSSVTLVHPTQLVEIFGNFFLPYDSPGSLVF